MFRIWFTTDRLEAIGIAERMARDNGCTVSGNSGVWEMYNPACPDKNAVVVQKARQYEPDGPEGYEVALRCNVYGDEEKWPRWLAERGVTPGRRRET